MITFFSCPKPFEGDIEIIQRNAIESWLKLSINAKIVLVGNERGVAEVCKEYGLTHIPDIKTNEYGTPLVNSIFETVELKYSESVLYCYINCDIIATESVSNAVRKLYNLNRKFLAFGKRWNCDINKRIDFSEDWESVLLKDVFANGKLAFYTAIDYFIFPKGIFKTIPPFAIGRWIWDNWLLYKAYSEKSMLIDLTEQVVIVHQNHSYNHYKQNEVPIQETPEAKENMRLAGNRRHALFINSATHHFRDGKLIKFTDFTHRWQYMQNLHISNMLLYLLLKPLLVIGNRLFRVS